MEPRTESGRVKAGRTRLMRRFGRDRRGSVGVEFALLAMPFALLVFATLESCVSFAAQEVLANATDEVARMIRTGQYKGAAISKTSLKKMICDRIEIVTPSGCPDLEVDLQQYDTFADAAAVETKFVTTAAGEKDLDTSPDVLKVTAGKSMSKNMLRVFYRWPVITDVMASSMSSIAGSKTLHFASTTWQNEPFDD